MALPCLLVACDDEKKGKGGSTAKFGSVSGSEKTVFAPVAFTATTKGLTVELAWSAPSDGVKVDSYEIYRDGTLVNTLSALQTAMTDNDVVPGKSYAYEIESHSKKLVSERASAEVKIAKPPLRAARVEGDFDVRTKVVSKSGYKDFAPATYGWHFRPQCGQGACAVVLRDVFERSVRSKLRRKGLHYDGTYKGFFFTKCSGTKSISSVDFSVKVARARAIAGEWRATKLVGTVTNSESAQFGCVSARAVLSFTARLRLAG